MVGFSVRVGSVSPRIAGLFLGGFVSVGGLIVGASLGAAAWAFAVPAVLLAVGGLWMSLPRPHRYWQWLALVPGCACGLVAGLALALQVASQSQVQLVVEATGFESAVTEILEQSDCPLARSVLLSDLVLLPQRLAPAWKVRWEMWDLAAKRGCVSGVELASARDQIKTHAQVAPLPPGMRRDVMPALPSPRSF